MKYIQFFLAVPVQITNHTGFSDPFFYYTFQHVLELAGHIGTGALKDIAYLNIQDLENYLHVSKQQKQ